MFHAERRWCVSTFAEGDIEEIASGLTGNTQVLCTGIRWRNLLLLNDATSEDGNQEYAVIDEKTGYQVESLTCSWMSPDRLKRVLVALSEGRDRVVMVTCWNNEKDPRERIEMREAHGRCRFCA